MNCTFLTRFPESGFLSVLAPGLESRLYAHKRNSISHPSGAKRKDPLQLIGREK